MNRRQVVIPVALGVGLACVAAALRALFLAGLVSIPLLAQQTREHLGGRWFKIHRFSVMDSGLTTRLVHGGLFDLDSLDGYASLVEYIGNDCIFAQRSVRSGYECFVVCGNEEPRVVWVSAVQSRVIDGVVEFMHVVDSEVQVAKRVALAGLRRPLG